MFLILKEEETKKKFTLNNFFTLFREKVLHNRLAHSVIKKCPMENIINIAMIFIRT
jgi:hypothetical protein